MQANKGTTFGLFSLNLPKNILSKNLIYFIEMKINIFGFLAIPRKASQSRDTYWASFLCAPLNVFRWGTFYKNANNYTSDDFLIKKWENLSNLGILLPLILNHYMLHLVSYSHFPLRWIFSECKFSRLFDGIYALFYLFFIND